MLEDLFIFDAVGHGYDFSGANRDTLTRWYSTRPVSFFNWVRSQESRP